MVFMANVNELKWLCLFHPSGNLNSLKTHLSYNFCIDTKLFVLTIGNMFFETTNV